MDEGEAELLHSASSRWKANLRRSPPHYDCTSENEIVSRESHSFVARKKNLNSLIEIKFNPLFVFIILINIIITILFTDLISTTEAQNLDPLSDSSTTKPLSEGRETEVLRSMRDWASRFGRDIHYGTQEATCLRPIRDRFDPAKRGDDHKASVVSIDWIRMHREIVKTISNTMGWHKSAVEAIARASEYLAGNHTFNKTLNFDYIDVHRLHDIDEIEEEPNDLAPADQIGEMSHKSNAHDRANLSASINQPEDDSSLLTTNQEMGQLNAYGQLISGDISREPPVEPLPKPSRLESAQSATDTAIDSNAAGLQSEWLETPARYLKLSKHRNFGDVLINTEESAVHVPVHIFPGDPNVMNGIAWSDGLTKVFRDNFVRNPKLTNQYFASHYGFMRLFPAQKWQIARMDPDLYDARMRPWYVAGASSRKDVIILVDSSGSMTGSRRDIAKGVVFEILDTLTDNDHFTILKFSDTIQQVGVPSCPEMRTEQKSSPIPSKNILFHQDSAERLIENGTDLNSLFLMPATGRNVRHIKSNFTIPTSGIANFSHALVTAFEVLHKYRDLENLGSQCNQAIMLITDGTPSDFQDIFKLYNHPNAPVRVFTYLIGREAGDVTHTKMMACHNRGFYTHVINLAEVRETVQQYIPVMARPLVLNGSHPVSWTPAYGELTYQILTDWIWESKRRDKARAILASHGRGSPSNTGQVPNIRVTNDDGTSYFNEDENYEASLDEELDAIDLFGYNKNPDCFWQTRRSDLLTTVVQPVYDRRNESTVTEKFLVKNVWTVKETVMRTAQILGVAAADMKINDIIALAPSHKLGANGYAIMITNNGYAMHHPDLRSVLEPFSSDPSEANMRILKPFFSSLDLTQVEHILNPASDRDFIELRKEAVSGKVGVRELKTKRALDCQKRVQTRSQSFYYKPVQQFPFSIMIAIPQPYGSHRVEAQIQIKSSSLPEKLTTYFTTSDYDIWTVHPDYQYCDGPSNNTITTLLDMFQRIEAGKLDDIQWQAPESGGPPIFFPGKIVCDQDLVQSLVYDAFATFGFSESCGPPSPNSESSLLGMLGVRFSFVVTRSGLTRVRHYDADDIAVKNEALAFARKHARAVDETFYSRTVDYNMLMNDSATLIQVPFNTYEKIRDRFNRWELNQAFDPEFSSNLESSINQMDSSLGSTILGGSGSRLSIKDMTLEQKLELLANSSLHVIATQSIIVNEGSQQAVAGVIGAFYDYSSFVWRLLNSTNSKLQEGQPIERPANSCPDGASTDGSCEDSKPIRCGSLNDTIDCLLIDNNGYIVFSEDLDFIGRHLKAYDSGIMDKLLRKSVFQEINITDYQSVCLKKEEKQTTSNAISSLLFRPIRLLPAVGTVISNLVTAFSYSWTILTTSGLLGANHVLAQAPIPSNKQQPLPKLPDKTYLRPCEKTLRLYETKPGYPSSNLVEYYTTRCGCDAWFAYEQVTKTNLIMLIVDTTPSCRHSCDPGYQQMDPTDPIDAKFANTEQQVCSMLERESQLYRKKLDTCFAHHPEEEHIKICGAASKSVFSFTYIMIFVIMLISTGSTLICFNFIII